MKFWICRIITLLFLSVWLLSTAHADALKPTSDGWLTFGEIGGGCNGSVNAVAVGARGEVYVGGDFAQCGNTLVNNIARYENGVWYTLGEGVNNTVYALAVSGSILYVGGYFSSIGNRVGGQTVNYIAQWDGAAWSSLDNGVNSGVRTLAVSGSTLYAGGLFTSAGGQAANYIAQWNIGNSSWSALGAGSANGVNFWVYALAVSGATVYAGGAFTNAVGQAANHIAQWNIGNSTWSALNDKSVINVVNNSVYALAVSSPTMYAGGGFTSVGGQTANHIAQWNGTAWATLGSGPANGVNDAVVALAASGSTVYAGGLFTSAGGQAANHVAQWNGTAWSALSSGPTNGVNNSVSALAVSGATVYAGGRFTSAGGQAANHIAQWDGATWSPLGNGVNNWVNALAVSGSTVYAGGDFTIVGGQAANHIAQWDGSQWTPLTTGAINGVTDGSVLALAYNPNTGWLAVGGHFSSAASPTPCLALWHHGSQVWIPFGISPAAFPSSCTIQSLAWIGNELYVGGAGLSPSTTDADYYLARLSFSNDVFTSAKRSALGRGVEEGDVYALAPDTSRNWLYVGGRFTTAGGEASINIAISEADVLFRNGFEVH